MRSERGTPKIYVVAPGGRRGPGGIGTLVGATVRHWRARGLRPALRVIDPYGPKLSAKTLLYFARALAQIGWNGWRGRIALVHVHMAWRGSFVRKGIIVHLATRLGVPVLLHTHGSRLDEWYPRLPGWARRLARGVFAAADRVIVPGEYWRGVLVGMVRIDPGAVRVLPNAIAGPARVASRPSRATCEIAFVGKMSSHKGLPELLQALARAEVLELEWRLSVAGYGDGRAFVEQAAALGIAHRVEFLGHVPEDQLQALLDRADVFALPSHNEGLSLAMLEAMAHGCAVVTTAAGATLDAVADGESALLVPVAAPGRLAAALRRLITEPELRRALQANGRQRWSDRFEIGEHCRRVRELYGELLPALVESAAADAAPEDLAVGAARGTIMGSVRARSAPTQSPSQ